MPRHRKRGGHSLSVTTTARSQDARALAGLARWLERAAPRTARGTVTVALVSDATMRRLNRRYRGSDYATDVLSFGMEKRPRRSSYEIRKRTSEVFSLGDIAIATGVARRQAREQSHSLGTELRILALHGLLHLLGYDHETDRGQMRRIEERLRRRARLPSSLTGRPPLKK